MAYRKKRRSFKRGRGRGKRKYGTAPKIGRQYIGVRL